ncbi:hypothetical protein PVAP13_3NG264201 [Panicum virgatum]|uniref:Uncharacterized protein n=1 Tax=Panicum virgatum TaxID=38727 RepID=A0A8T0UNS4_PANVG|nr:hypothetical protein PVAP13_3NG264201 [Panicum virgatum]
MYVCMYTSLIMRSAPYGRRRSARSPGASCGRWRPAPGSPRPARRAASSPRPPPPPPPRAASHPPRGRGRLAGSPRAAGATGWRRPRGPAPPTPRRPWRAAKPVASRGRARG